MDHCHHPGNLRTIVQANIAPGNLKFYYDFVPPMPLKKDDIT